MVGLTILLSIVVTKKINPLSNNLPWAYKCAICQSESPTKYAIDQHMQSAHGINKFLLCKKCSVYFPVAELNQHRMACGKNINNENSENTESQLNTSENPTSDVNDTLNLPSTEIKNYERIPEDLKDFNNENLDPVNYTEKPSDQINVTKEIENQKSLQETEGCEKDPLMIETTANKPALVSMEKPQPKKQDQTLKCPHCDLQFSDKNQLMKHIEIIRSRIKLRTCHICVMQFKTKDWKDLLFKHIR